jgi:hypothetical protein
MPKIKKIRKRCILCGAMKYTKYLSKGGGEKNDPRIFWYCKNEDKCVHRSANYKK